MKRRKSAAKDLIGRCFGRDLRVLDLVSVVDVVRGFLHHETERDSETDSKNDCAEPGPAFCGHPFDQADGFYE
jgi:hypothetical protein